MAAVSECTATHVAAAAAWGGHADTGRGVVDLTSWAGTAAAGAASASGELVDCRAGAVGFADGCKANIDVDSERSEQCADHTKIDVGVRSCLQISKGSSVKVGGDVDEADINACSDTETYVDRGLDDGLGSDVKSNKPEKIGRYRAIQRQAFSELYRRENSGIDAVAGNHRTGGVANQRSDTQADCAQVDSHGEVDQGAFFELASRV